MAPSVLLFHRIVALACGGSIVVAAVLSGRWAAHWMAFYLDVRTNCPECDVEIPAVTNALLSAPQLVYLATGVVLGLAVGGLMWRCRPGWMTLVNVAVVALCVCVFLMFFEATMRAPLDAAIPVIDDRSDVDDGKTANQAMQQTRDEARRHG